MYDNSQEPTGLDIVADYDYSDAPEWALPREWLINNQYDLEFEEI
jgi:hypothetical protein